MTVRCPHRLTCTRVYVDWAGAGDLDDSQLTLEWDAPSFRLSIRTRKPGGEAAAAGVNPGAMGVVLLHMLTVDALYQPIAAASLRKKADSVVVSLTKQDGGVTWHGLRQS